MSGSGLLATALPQARCASILASSVQGRRSSAHGRHRSDGGVSAGEDEEGEINDGDDNAGEDLAGSSGCVVSTGKGRWLRLGATLLATATSTIDDGAKSNLQRTTIFIALTPSQPLPTILSGGIRAM